MLPACEINSQVKDTNPAMCIITTPTTSTVTEGSSYVKLSPRETLRKFSRTFDFDLTSIPPDTTEPSPVLENLPLVSSSDGTLRKTDLRIELPNQPTLVVQSPKTPTLSRKLKAISLDSDSNASNPPDCLDVPRDVISMPNTPKRQIPKSQIQKLGVRSHSGSNLGHDNTPSLSSLGSNQSISGSQTLKTLPEIMTLSDFGQGKKEPVRIRAKGLLERRGSNVSLTIDLCAAESRNSSNYRLNAARSVSNLNLTNFGGSTSDKCKCINSTELKCECNPKRKDCKKCNAGLKRFQRLSTESCLCDETSNNATCQGYKICQYSRLGCLNYLSYMRRKSLSNENLYIGPSYEFKKVHKKSEYPKHLASEFKNQILSEDFQLHLQNIQYLQTAGNVLSKKQLQDCCKVENVKDLHKEFWELPQNFQEKSFVSGSQMKNRYKTILPNEHSRVVLEQAEGQDATGIEGYINANYIKGPDYTETAYIATQGPLPNTTGDLWQMVLQSNAQKVIMLTAVQEQGRIKCELYFPQNPGETISCAKYQITCMNVLIEKSYTIRVLRVRDANVAQRQNELVKEEPKRSESRCCDKVKARNLTNEMNQSPNHISLFSPEIDNNNCGRFFNNDVTEFDEDDIFTNMDFKANNKPRVPLRSRDCKFSDDFTDYIISAVPNDIDGHNFKNETRSKEFLSQCDDVLETDRIIYHYWYSTWPDHHMANTEEVLALALDVLDLRHEMQSLYTHTNRASHFNVINVNTNLNLSSTCNNSYNESCNSTPNIVESVKNVDHQRKSLAEIVTTECCTSKMTRSLDKKPEANGATATVTQVPMVVHCSAGIGRTGCFLAILNGIQQLKQNLNVDVLAIVCALRLNRGGMVQTAEQYELVHKVLAMYGDNCC